MSITKKIIKEAIEQYNKSSQENAARIKEAAEKGQEIDKMIEENKKMLDACRNSLDRVKQMEREAMDDFSQFVKTHPEFADQFERLKELTGYIDKKDLH